MNEQMCTVLNYRHGLVSLSSEYCSALLSLLRLFLTVMPLIDQTSFLVRGHIRDLMNSQTNSNGQLMGITTRYVKSSTIEQNDNVDIKTTAKSLIQNNENK